MESLEPYPSLALAILAGLLIGLEREQTRPAPETARGFVGGIRTYPIIALMGAVAALLAPSYGPWVVVTAGIGLSLLLAMTYWRDSGTGHLGVTSESSALLTFLLGALAASPSIIFPLSRRIFVVASIAVAATVLLSTKTQLRALSSKISKEDIIATLKFLLVSVVVMPLLPDEALGPYGVLNPFRIGLMVVLIAAIGFAGYVAIRLLGTERGLLVIGAVGGLVSSTAVTLASAARAKQSPSLAPQSALAVIIASTIMMLRVGVTVFVVQPSLVQPLLIPLGAMSAVGVAFLVVFAVRDRPNRSVSPELDLSNPFELSSALKFGAFFIVILLVSRWATVQLGAGGAYLTGFIAGAAEVDAITLSMADLVGSNQLSIEVASKAIVIAAASNTMVKGILAFVLGGATFGRRIVLAFSTMVAIGGVTLVLF